MAVYTQLKKQDVEEFLARYDHGALVGFSPIEEGIENTNYMVETTNSKFILTIYEKRVDTSELPFFLSLTDHLRNKGINCPVTLPSRDGAQIQDFMGKKACLISFLIGKGVTKIEDYHMAELGGKVARMHLAVQDFRQNRKNDFGLAKWSKLLEATAPRADELQKGLAKFIADEIYFLAANWPFNLPAGVIHADIFPDNVFFIGEKISGVIDFYFACSDYFAYDVAICFNAWGIETDTRRQKLFLEGYEAVRPLKAEEKAAMPVLLRGAATRFLLTRLYDWFNTPEGAVVKKKDPLEYLKKLELLNNIDSSARSAFN